MWPLFIYAMPSCLLSCCAMQCCGLVWFSVWCYAMSCFYFLCCTSLCHALMCCAMLHCAVLPLAMLELIWSVLCIPVPCHPLLWCCAVCVTWLLLWNESVLVKILPECLVLNMQFVLFSGCRFSRSYIKHPRTIIPSWDPHAITGIVNMQDPKVMFLVTNLIFPHIVLFTD